MCKLYLVSRAGARRLATGGGVLAAPLSEGATMGDLHYMEMGWAGSGWMDPLPGGPTAAPGAAPPRAPLTPMPAGEPEEADQAARTGERARPVARKSAKKTAKRPA